MARARCGAFIWRRFGACDIGEGDLHPAMAFGHRHRNPFCGVVRGKFDGAWPAPDVGHLFGDGLAPAISEKAIFTLQWLSATGTGILFAALCAGSLMGHGPRQMWGIYLETVWRLRYRRRRSSPCNGFRPPAPESFLRRCAREV